MGEADRRGGKRAPSQTAHPVLTRDGRVTAGRVGIALVVPGIDPLVMAFEADTVERLVAEVDRSLKMTEAGRNNPAVHAGLWRAVLDLTRRIGREDSFTPRERLGRNALWLMLNKPGGDIRREHDALRRNGLAPHFTATADAMGRWHCAVGSRFDGAAEVTARTLGSQAAGPEGRVLH